jgi:hypothetical protein
LDEDEEIVKSFLIETILLSSQRFDSKITITSKGLVLAEKDDMSKIRRKIPFSRLKALNHMNWEGQLLVGIEVIDENPEFIVQQWPQIYDEIGTLWLQNCVKFFSKTLGSLNLIAESIFIILFSNWLSGWLIVVIDIKEFIKMEHFDRTGNELLVIEEVPPTQDENQTHEDIENESPMVRRMTSGFNKKDSFKLHPDIDGDLDVNLWLFFRLNKTIFMARKERGIKRRIIKKSKGQLSALFQN